MNPGSGSPDPSSAGFPATAGVAAETPVLLSRRRRRTGRELATRYLGPYALLAPTLLVLGAVLGYPLYMLVRLSLSHYGLSELIAHKGTWAGLANYTTILHDSLFWKVVLRTVIFTGVNVGLTMVLGTLIALLLAQLGGFMRIFLSAGLVFVWSIPRIVGINIWQWMVDFEFGVLNWTLTQLHIGNFIHHNWFARPIEGFAVITAAVVWYSIPFVTITVFAGLAQLPQDLVEAASIDGAGGWRVFRDITVPILKPIFLITASLSIIWDFQTFDQVIILRDLRPSDDYYLMSIYAFVESFRISQYGLGAAISVVTVMMLAAVSFFYVRQMVRIGEAE
jgi:N,N'-diacetylchitobiose transport system permease protein